MTCFNPHALFSQAQSHNLYSNTACLYSILQISNNAGKKWIIAKKMNCFGVISEFVVCLYGTFQKSFSNIEQKLSSIEHFFAVWTVGIYFLCWRDLGIDTYILNESRHSSVLCGPRTGCMCKRSEYIERNNKVMIFMHFYLHDVLFKWHQIYSGVVQSYTESAHCVISQSSGVAQWIFTESAHRLIFYWEHAGIWICHTVYGVMKVVSNWLSGYKWHWVMPNYWRIVRTPTDFDETWCVWSAYCAYPSCRFLAPYTT